MLIIVLLFVLTGFISYQNMPRTEDPQMDFSGGVIVAIWPGAAPVDMERLVVDIIEEELNELDDIKKLKTTIEEGVSVTELEFETGTDPDKKYQKILSSIDAVRNEMPSTLLSLSSEQYSSANVNIMQVALKSEYKSYDELNREAEALKRMFLRVPGVKIVEIEACPEQEVTIAVNPQKAEKLGLSISTIIDIVRGVNANIPAGNVQAGTQKFSVKTSGSYKTIEQIRNTVIRSGTNGVLTLDDIADVIENDKQDSYFARHNGERAIWITVQQKHGTNIINVTDGLKEKLNSYTETLNGDIETELFFDLSDSVKGRLNGFFMNLVQGIVLVGVIALLALGFRISVIVMTVIPASILTAIGLLDSSGYGLNQISIIGLVVAIGLLVDNAIVVVENISRLMKEGEPVGTAIIKGASQVGWAIVSSTATTVFAFLPMLFIKSTTGDFIRTLPLIVIYTLIASMLISLTLTPYLLGLFLRGVDSREFAEKRTRTQSLLYKVSEGIYKKLLIFSVDNSIKTIIAAAAIFVLSMFIFTKVGVSLFPKAEKNLLLVDIETPPSTSISRTDSITAEVEKILETQSGVLNYGTNIGRGNPVVYYNMTSDKEAANIAQILVETETAEISAVEKIVSELRAELDNVAGAEIEVKEFLQGDMIEAPIVVRVISNNFNRLKERAVVVENLINSIEGTVNVDNNSRKTRTDLKIDYNREKAAMLGVPLYSSDMLIRTALAGTTVGEFKDSTGEKVDIRVLLNSHISSAADDIDKISVPSLNGQQIPLKQFSEIRFDEAPSVINHHLLDRVALITSDVKRGYVTATLTAEIVEELKKMNWDSDLTYSLGGDEEVRQDSFGGMGKALLIALMGVFAILVLQFGSFKQPFIVFAAIPFSITGAIWALYFTGYTFSFTAFIGLTSLMGIVVNNSIILVDYANGEIKKGKSVYDAAISAGTTRFVPILLTTLTTVGGLIPLVISGSTMWSPLAIAIIGGLLFSTFLTLIVVPVLYKLITSDR